MISTRSRFRISPAGAGVRGWVACPGPGGGAHERHGDHWPPVRLPGRFPRQKGRGQGVGASLSTKTHTAAQGGSAAGAPDRPGPWSLRKGPGAQEGFPSPFPPIRMRHIPVSTRPTAGGARAGKRARKRRGKGGLGGKGEGKPGLCGSRTDKLTVWGLRFHPRLPRAGRWGARTPRRPQAPIPIPKFSKKLPPFPGGLKLKNFILKSH